MKSPRKTGNFSTSFLDVILGALGAFFLLLILVSVSRRGDAEEEGTDVPSNMLTFKVTNQKNFVIGDHIRFFVTIVNEGRNIEPSPIIFFSETLKSDDQTPTESAIGVPRLKITRSGNSANNYEMALLDKAKDAPNVLVCIWVADWPSNSSVKELLAGDGKGISIEVLWNDKEYGVKKTVELVKDNGFTSVFFLKDRETQGSLISKAIEIISYRNTSAAPLNPPNWGDLKKEKFLDKRKLVGSTPLGSPRVDKWNLCYDNIEPLGKFNNLSDNSNNKLERPNVYFLESKKGEKKNFTKIVNEKVNNLGRAVSQTKISYVAWGKRAICVRFEEEERNLYVCPQYNWKNVADFVEGGLLTPVNEEGEWYLFEQTKSIERYKELYPVEADAELALKYWADAIASPIYETNSPLTQVSPLVMCVKKSDQSKQ